MISFSRPIYSIQFIHLLMKTIHFIKEQEYLNIFRWNPKSNKTENATIRK